MTTPVGEAEIQVGRRLERSTQRLRNGVVLEAHPLARPKGRHWAAYRGNELVGEFRTWQQTTYTTETTEERDSYGMVRRVSKASYPTQMVRESWVLGEDREDPHPSRAFNTIKGEKGWRALISELPRRTPKTIPRHP